MESIKIPEYKITYSLTKEEFDAEIKILLNTDDIIFIKKGKEIIICKSLETTQIEEPEIISEQTPEKEEYIPILSNISLCKYSS